MKIDRLIGILSILLQQDKVTAPYLAEKFEVSRRTINRDIEDICKAGIPLVTTQGKGGGITIMEGYRIDRTLLTSSDMQAILAGIRSLDSISKTTRYQQLMDKLSAGSSEVLTSNNHIIIDLSSWYKTTLAPKISLLQAAIERRETVAFTYYAQSGEGHREIEPYVLTFQWSSWYVWGYCLERQDYRLFKLNRMQELEDTGEAYAPRSLPPFSVREGRWSRMGLQAEAVFDPEMKWRLVDEYGMDCFREREDGKLLFQYGFMDESSLFSWLLTFGEHVELVKPEETKEHFVQMLERIEKIYIK